MSTNLWFMESGDSMPYSQVLSNNSYADPNHPIPRIANHFSKIHSNIVLQSTQKNNNNNKAVICVEIGQGSCT